MAIRTGGKRADVMRAGATPKESTGLVVSRSPGLTVIQLIRSIEIPRKGLKPTLLPVPCMGRGSFAETPTGRRV